MAGRLPSPAGAGSRRGATAAAGPTTGMWLGRDPFSDGQRMSGVSASQPDRFRSLRLAGAR
jgi:hypothetical protein